MSPTDTQSHAEFVAAHQSEMADHAATLQAAKDRAAEIVARADAAHATATTQARASHAEEIEKRTTSFQVYAQEAFAPAVDDFERDPNRQKVIALQAVFEQVDTESMRALGRPLGYELAQSMASQHLRSNPAGLAQLAQRTNWFDTGIGASIATANENALRALRRRTDFAGMLAALISLEAQISRVAAPGGGQSCNGDPAEVWRIVVYGGSQSAIDAQLKEIDARVFVAKHGTPEERQAKFYRFRDERDGQKMPSSVIGAARDAIADLLFGSQQGHNPVPQPARGLPQQ